MTAAQLASASYEPTVNEVKVPILNRDLCNEWLVQLNVTDGMLCAGYSEGMINYDNFVRKKPLAKQFFFLSSYPVDHFFVLTCL